MTIEAILFDLDDTLVVEEVSVEEAFLATAERVHGKFGIDPAGFNLAIRRHARRIWQAAATIDYCRTIGISSWEGLWARFLGDEENLKALREWAPTYRREAWAAALAEYDVDDMPFAEELAKIFQEERRSRHIPFLDSEPVLKGLRGKYRLGLVSNGLSCLQREKVEGAGWIEYFDSITISGEVGIGKPDTRIFNAALKSLNVGCEKAVMVGNSLKRDIAGAQQAGIRAIWINRSGAEVRGDITPDFQIRNLSELPKML